MGLLRQVRHGLRRLLDREGSESDLTDEVRHWVELATADLVAGGVPPEEARRRVRQELGSETAIRDEVRSYGWERVAESVARDVGYGWRRLRRSPGFTLLSVVTLAVGVGTTTAILSVAWPVLVESLPYPDAGRLVAISDRGADGAPVDVTFGSFLELQARTRAFEALAVIRPWQPTLTGVTEAERLTGQRVSAEYFRVLGVSPALGRPFDGESDRAGGPNEVILSHGLWRDRFAGDGAIVGRSVTLDGQPHTVVGVMGAGFENVLAPAAGVWAPLQYDEGLPSFDAREWGHHLRMVGRLADGMTLVDARRDLDRVADSPVPELPRPEWATLDQGLVVTPMKEAITRAARPALLAIAGAVGLLLLISCVNMTNLLIGRGVRRRGELEMRAALGARRGRLVQQLLTESLLVSLLGGAVGVGLGAVGVRSLVALAPPALPRLEAVRLDPAVLVLALGITTVIGAVAGLVPAIGGAVGVGRAAGSSGRRSTDRHGRIRSSLVVAEVSLTLVLLVAAGLLLRSLDRLFANDPGFEPAGVVALQVQLSGQRLQDDDATRHHAEAILASALGVAGVTRAAMTSQLPLTGELDQYGVRAQTSESVPEEAAGSALRYAVSPSYFETLGIPLRRGRLLRQTDDSGAPPVTVLSASLAGRLFPGLDPIGRRVHIGRLDRPPYTVVGVVDDVKQTSLAAERSEAAYVSPGQWYFADRTVWLTVRTGGDPSALVEGLKRAIWSVDADQPIVRIELAEDLVAGSAADRRFALRLFGVFAVAALLLAAVGLYGVLAGAVTERVREMGIRGALGATRRDLVSLVVRHGLLLTGLGTLIGILGAGALSRTLRSLLYGISPLDPATYVGMTLLLVGAGVAASAVPAWRAARIDPSSALRLD